MEEKIKKPRKQRTIKPKGGVSEILDGLKIPKNGIKNVEVVAPDYIKKYCAPRVDILLAFPDDKCEFISDLTNSICKWRSKPGKEAMAYAQTYENVLCELLKPDME